jgi:hypothetical protein
LRVHLPPPASRPQAALQLAQRSWRPCGLLSEEAQSSALSLCTRLLEELKAHGDKWATPPAVLLDTDKASRRL